MRCNYEITKQSDQFFVPLIEQFHSALCPCNTLVCQDDRKRGNGIERLVEMSLFETDLENRRKRCRIRQAQALLDLLLQFGPPIRFDDLAMQHRNEECREAALNRTIDAIARLENHPFTARYFV